MAFEGAYSARLPWVDWWALRASVLPPAALQMHRVADLAATANGISKRHTTSRITEIVFT